MDYTGQGTRERPEDIQERMWQAFLETVTAFFFFFLMSSFFHIVSKQDACVWWCVHSQVESIDDQVREKLLLVKNGNVTQLEEKEKNELKKRKLLAEV